MIWRNICRFTIINFLIIAIIMSGCSSDKMIETIKPEQGNVTTVKNTTFSSEIPVTGDRNSKIQSLVLGSMSLANVETPAADSSDTGTPVDSTISTPTETSLPPVLASETPSPELTPTPELISESETPTTVATETNSWSVEAIVPVSPQDANQAGGLSSTQAQFVNQFNNQISDPSVQVQVLPQTNAAAGISGTAFTVLVKGDGGIDQFKNTIYKDLSSKIHLFNGVTTLTISGNTTAGQDMPVRLESNPSTGHIWDVSIIDPLYVQVLKESKFERKGNKFGSPMVQVVSLKGVSNGSTTMQLTYHRPWEKGLPVSNKVNLQIGSGLSNIDLSVPVSSAASQALTSPLPNPETPPQAEALSVPTFILFRVENQPGFNNIGQIMQTSPYHNWTGVTICFSSQEPT